MANALTRTTLLTWNIQRRAPTTWQAERLMDRIAREAPDVLCLTEAWAGSAAALGGHELTVRGAVWDKNQRDGERLVVLWSAAPWRAIVIGGDEDVAAGGLIRAVTETRAGWLQVIGLCAPSHFGSPVDIPARAKPWTEQMRFWRGLARVMAGRLPDLPTAVLGDFNQFVPRIWGAKAPHEACLAALDGLIFATAGQIEDAEKAAIDHIAHTPDWTVSDVRALSRFAQDGRVLSDHFGVVGRAGPADVHRARFEPDEPVAPAALA